ncbi:MAG: divalent-cation tolerance protein CutA [Myxococcales bacterium]|nr:divalent-cation tolerance protein CutA [Myxococcales bacterium]
MDRTQPPTAVESADGLAVVLTTLPSLEVARELTRVLVSERLAACANLVPGVLSIYAWKDEICEDDEVLCLLKVRRERLGELHTRLATLHPYDVPEFLVLEPEAVSGPYRRWLLDVTG